MRARVLQGQGIPPVKHPKIPRNAGSKGSLFLARASAPDMKTAIIASGVVLVLVIAAVAVVGFQVAQQPVQSSSAIGSGTAAASGASTTGSVSGATSSAASTSILGAGSTTSRQQGSTGDFAMMA